MTDTNQLPPLPPLQPGGSHMESLIEAAIQGHASTREAMRWLVRQLVPMQARAQVQGEPVNLQHMAVAENGALRWMTGRKVQNCELYAMPDFGRAPTLYTTPQPAQATQAEVTDERAAFEEWATNEGKWPKAVDRDHNGCYLLLQTSYAWTVWQARAILALRPERVPMTDEEIFNAYCKSDSILSTHITNLVAFAKAIEAHHGITAQAKKETP